jgi:hypothetical protein
LQIYTANALGAPSDPPRRNLLTDARGGKVQRFSATGTLDSGIAQPAPNAL